MNEGIRFNGTSAQNRPFSAKNVLIHKTISKIKGNDFTKTIHDNQYKTIRIINKTIRKVSIISQQSNND